MTFILSLAARPPARTFEGVLSVLGQASPLKAYTRTVEPSSIARVV